jgi:hypothetical protein
LTRLSGSTVFRQHLLVHRAGHPRQLCLGPAARQCRFLPRRGRPPSEQRSGVVRQVPLGRAD